MEQKILRELPSKCPSCEATLAVSALTCPSCGTEVRGSYALRRLARLREPHASFIELFLRVRGNMKELERALGLSYPTVRTRLEDALSAAGLDRLDAGKAETPSRQARIAIIESLERGEIDGAQAAAQLRALRAGRSI
jgi:hypothetical protein